MPYSTAAGVKLLIDTSLSDTTIEELIAKVDAEIDDEHAGEGISVPSPTPSLIVRASENLTAAKILSRNWVTAPKPIWQQTEKLEKIGYVAIKDHIRQSKGMPPIFSVIENKTDME